jgi:hypothetical protein
MKLYQGVPEVIQRLTFHPSARCPPNIRPRDLMSVPGLKADIGGRSEEVCFTPRSGHHAFLSTRPEATPGKQWSEQPLATAQLGQRASDRDYADPVIVRALDLHRSRRLRSAQPARVLRDPLANPTVSLDPHGEEARTRRLRTMLRIAGRTMRPQTDHHPSRRAQARSSG